MDRGQQMHDRLWLVGVSLMVVLGLIALSRANKPLDYLASALALAAAALFAVAGELGRRRSSRRTPPE